MTGSGGAPRSDLTSVRLESETISDLYAGLAMADLMQSLGSRYVTTDAANRRFIAAAAHEMAGAMMKERFARMNGPVETPPDSQPGERMIACMPLSDEHAPLVMSRVHANAQQIEFSAFCCPEGDEIVIRKNGRMIEVVYRPKNT